MTSRIGLLGGSFNPIHFGHLIPARAAAERLRLDRVIFIPTGTPPHKSADGLASAEDRVAMTRLAVANDPGFEVSDVEIRRDGPSYTIDTVDWFRQQLGPAAELFWLIGADTLPELATWRRIDELLSRVIIVTLTRPGGAAAPLDALEARVGREAVEILRSQQIETPAIEISATDIRRRIGAGLSIQWLAPESVVRYISQNPGVLSGGAR